MYGNVAVRGKNNNEQDWTMILRGKRYSFNIKCKAGEYECEDVELFTIPFLRYDMYDVAVDISNPPTRLIQDSSSVDFFVSFIQFNIGDKSQINWIPIV
jgi:hypothetical protein